MLTHAIAPPDPWAAAPMDAGVNSLSFPNAALERPPSESLASALPRNGESSNPRPIPGTKSDFMRASADKEPVQRDEAEASATHVRALAAVAQQQKTRRRRDLSERWPF